MATQVTLNSGSVDSAGSLALKTNGTTTAVTIDTSQNVGIGTASPASKLQVNGIVAGTSTGVDGTFAGVFNALYSSDTAFYGQIQHSMSSSATASGFRFMGGGTGNVSGSGGLQKMLDLTRGQTIFYTGDTERARIDSSGNLLVGVTSGSDGKIKVDGTGNATNCAVWAKNSAGSSSGTYVCWNAATSGNNQFIDFYTETAATQRGSLYYDRVAGQTKLSATSDKRLKENIIDAPFALPVIESIKVRQYDWKETGITNIGFIAQELHTVVDRAVSVGEDNEDGTIKRPWGVDNGTLVPYLVKAIQEQQALITTLTDRITALESKA